MTEVLPLLLPLAPANYAVVARREEIRAGAQWPPRRFVDRDSRLGLFADLYRGDLTSLVDTETENVRLAVNYFGRLSVVQSEILMMSVPEAPLDIGDIAGQALVDMSRYGTAWLWAGELAELPFVANVDARDVYPLDEGGWVLVSLFASADAPDSRPNRSEVWTIAADGQMSREEYNWQGARGAGTLGSLVGEEAVDGTATLIPAPRAPHVGLSWGTSQYPDLIAPVLEIAKRFSSNSRTLDEHADPLLAVYMASGAVNTRFNPDPPVSQTKDERQERIYTRLRDFRRNPVVNIPNADVKMEYVTWDADLEASFSQIEEARLAIQYITGLVQLLERSQGGLSGVALRRLMLPLYAGTKAMQNELKQRLDDALSFALDEDVEIEWPHVFDTLDGVDAPTINRPDVSGGGGSL